MADAVSAKQILQHLSPYDLDKVSFRTPDGLPIVAVYINTDCEGGAVITMSDVESITSDL